MGSPFPELHEWSSEFQSLPVEQAHLILQDILKRAGPRIDYQFFSLTSATFATAGSLALVALQFALLLHMLEMEGSDALRSESIRFTWLGFYRSRWSQVFATIQIVVLPFAVHCILSEVEGADMLRSASVAFGIVLCFATSGVYYVLVREDVAG